MSSIYSTIFGCFVSKVQNFFFKIRLMERSDHFKSIFKAKQLENGSKINISKKIVELKDLKSSKDFKSKY